MATVLSKETMQDDIALSAAQVLASANRRAIELGVDLKESLITLSQHSANGDLMWRVHYGPRNYIGRRGGDLTIDLGAANADIRQVLRGQ